MTSMLDQYAQASQKSKLENIHPEMTTSGFIEMPSQEDPPIFSRQKLNFTPTDRITHLVVSNDYLVLTMANNILFRIDLKHPEKHEEITLSKYTASSRLTSLFLDPLGQHLLIAFGARTSEGTTELLYLPRKNSKLRNTSRFKGHEITAIAWNYNNDSDNSTGPILLGTSKGLIFETEIAFDGDKIFQTGIEQYWRQVFEIGKDVSTPITGLEFHRVPNTDRYFVLVTTPNCLYQFIGNANSDEKPLLQQIFSSYLNVEESPIRVNSSLKYSKLNFFYHQPRGLPKTFAWLVQLGILYGELDPFGHEDINAVLKISETIEYPSSAIKSANQVPISFVITEFHALLLYSDKIQGVSLLNGELIFEEFFNESYGKPVNIVRDIVRGTIWAFTDKMIFRYKVTKEERNVWQIYCNKEKFELAKRYSKDNPAHFDKVLGKEAEFLFEKRDFIKSAERYSETQTSFEEICLKFLEINELNALKTFLRKKLDHFKIQDKTQITLIVIWVIELFLNQLGRLRLLRKENTSEYRDLQKEFDSFLAIQTVADCVKNNRQTVYDLMANHGDKENLIKLTILNKDLEQVIRQHIYKNSYHEALEILKSQNKRELFYLFIPILMQEIPKLTVNALISQGRSLSPVKLLPALVGCDNDEVHITEIIRYLEFCVHSLGTAETAIHNYLLSLYANYKPEKVMQYLQTQGQDRSMVFYDVHYALGLCQEKKLTEACVHLSALLGSWESAVDLALTVNIDLAKQTANMPESDNELRKKLWLKIAKHHIVSGKNDIQEAMKFLQQCDLIKIEDILPFFSDFDTIDHFKDAICTSLQEYNQNIQDLKDEMEEATKAAEMIRKEIQIFRNKCTVIKADDVCSICTLTLIIRPFYFFPCKHKFHTDCLLSELTPMLGPAKQNKLADLHRQLTTLNNSSDNVSMGSASLSARDQVKADIDNIVASECLYCGEYMIRDIDTPFIEDREFDRVMKEWM